MEAVRVHPNPDTSKPFSPTNPAPSSALVLDTGLPIPQLTRTGELLVKVKATTVIRDALTWPETYLEENRILGHDFAGEVVSVHEDTHNSPFKVGDEVYGMTHADRAGTWAQYVVAKVDETCLKPTSLSWAEAAAIPLTALTAYEALFEKAGVNTPDFSKGDKAPITHRLGSLANKDLLLVTGASGAVGAYTVQLAKLAGLYVVAATRYNERNKDFLIGLGADEVVEYNDLHQQPQRFQVIIDTVGGKVLESCWSLVRDHGILVSIDSASFDFVEAHQSLGLLQGRKNVRALFFIVYPSKSSLEQISMALELKLFRPLVADVVPLSEARLAYEGSMNASSGRGKLVLIP